MFVLHENACSNKRPRDCLETISGDSYEQTERARKRKRTARGDGHTGHWPPGFWDRLSQVHLTRGALREFERRTAQEGSGRAAAFPPATRYLSHCVHRIKAPSAQTVFEARWTRPDAHSRSKHGNSFRETLLQRSGSTNTIVVRSFPRPKGQHEPVEFQPEALVRFRSVRFGAKRLDTHEQRVIRPQF